VIDSTDCIMWTEGGRYTVDALRMMRDMIAETEAHQDPRKTFENAKRLAAIGGGHVLEAVASAAINTAIDTNARAIVVFTETGRTAKMVAKFRPPKLVLTVTSRDVTARHVNVYRGCMPVIVFSTFGVNNLTVHVLRAAAKRQVVSIDDHAVLVSGPTDGVSGHSNTIRVIAVRDVVRASDLLPNKQAPPPSPPH
jgi:pyruvate kinase